MPKFGDGCSSGIHLFMDSLAFIPVSGVVQSWLDSGFEQMCVAD